MPLLDGPLGFTGSEIARAPDSRSVVVSNVHLPLDVSDPAELEARKSSVFTVEIKVPTRNVVKITAKDLWLIRWDARTNIVSFKEGRDSFLSGKPGKDFDFRRNGTAWEELPPRIEQPSSNIAIVIEEDLNTPPRIVAISGSGHQRIILLDLNPHFKELEFARVKQISWRATDGHDVTGGLYLPRPYIKGQRYPLVIQTHGFTPNKFMIDGPWRTAFAAQALASLGFAVLQADLYKGADLDTAQGVSKEVASYEGAIDYLDSIGMIDRERVGIVGFSWTCLTVKYALTHSNYHFGAALVSDGIDAGYFQYIAFANADPGYVSESDMITGQRPFGEGLSSWLKISPGFALDRVKAPLLIEAVEGPPTVLTEWEWFSGLSRLGKPVDMLYLPEGAHSLVRPWEQMASQQATVDWFRFWLKGEEDADPTKADQYARWHELRKLHEEDMKRLASEPPN